MTDAKGKDQKKAQLRLLKLLLNANNEVAHFQASAAQFLIQLKGKTYKFESDLVFRCKKQGFLSICENDITITTEGRAVLVAALHPDMDYRSQHLAPVVKTIAENGIASQVTVNENESPLSRLYTRKDKHGKCWLNEFEFQAGERLRSDFEKSQLQPRISANWSASVATGSRGANMGADISDFAMDARKRIEKMVNALGPELSNILLDVCCFLKGLETIEKELHWPPRSAKLMLRTALRELVRHYGLRPSPRKQPMNHWGDSSYRPDSFV
ncbi:MAG: DUF6456 domain-containing protein [Salaquimonas sp.]